MEALLTAIVVWLAANFGLPANFQHPRVQMSSPQEIAALYNQNFLPAQRVEPTTSGSDETHLPRDVISLYDNVEHVIYLPAGWRGDNAAELSMLVHEMVHHLQSMAALKYECPQAREKLAFAAQDKWLQLFNSDLATAFGVDAFTLLVRTNCSQ